MNAVLYCSRVRKKMYDAVVKEMMDFSVVSSQNVAKSSSVSQIESLNPHCVIIDHSIKFKEIDLDGFLCLLNLKANNVRVIYNFGTVENLMDDDFKATLSLLQRQKVYDIIINDEEIKDVVENPMKFGDITEKITQIIEEKEKYTRKADKTDDEEEQKSEETYDEVKLNFFSLSERHDFDINTVTEIIDDGEDAKDNCLTIALMQLQHHLGCTKTAFDIAQYLSSKNKNPCVVMSDEVTYTNMLRYYKFKTTSGSEGFSLNNVHVLPYDALETAQQNYSHVIIDIGYFKPEIHELVFRKSDVKIMMCSSAEWDLIHVSRWLNYPKYNYTRDINYLFASTKERYIQINKSLLKGSCVANRIDYNDDHHNKKVYGLILKRYELTKPNMQRKRRMMKLK